MSVISSGRQAEGELYTWARVSPKGPSSLTAWRTKGRAGNQEATGEEDEGEEERWGQEGQEGRGGAQGVQGLQAQGGSSADRALLGFDGAPLVPQLTPQLTDRQA